MEKEYEFTALIQKELFYNDKTCYGIFTFTTTDNLPYLEDVYIGKKGVNVKYGTLVGNCQRLDEGQEYNIIGILIENKKYGWQYKFVNVTKDIPKSEDDNRNYLKSIIPESQANILLENYPNIIENIIENADFKPDYSLLYGIKEKTFERIKEKILDTYVISDILALLSPLGVTFTMIKRISEKEKNVSLLKQKLIDNPYQLIGMVPRLTFLKVDKFALELNPDLLKSKIRTYAAIDYVLGKYGEDDGHTLIQLKVLREKMKKLIPQAIEVYDEIIETEKINNLCGLINKLYIKNEMCGLAIYYRMEKYIYEKLLSIANNEYRFNIEDYNKIIETTNQQLGFNLSEEQEDVICSIANNNVLLISGKAGVGKTTVIKGIVNAYSNYRINICALSAKAARRATEVTGHSASTIHKLLEYNGMKFERNEHNTLSCNILIIDESSMINVYLFYSLLKALPLNCKVIIVGDHLQLPPIGAGAPFFDLLNMSNSEFINIRLNTIYRQAQESGIVVDANKIREGIIPFEGVHSQIISGQKKDMRYIFKENVDDIQKIIVSLFIGYLDRGTNIEDISVIVPRKDGVTNSTKNINKIIMDTLLPSNEYNTIKLGEKEFRLNCRVINTVNMYTVKTLTNETVDVLNGEMGTVVTIVNGKDREVVVDFGDKIVKFKNEDIFNLDLGYCLTIHKKQGDQSKVVIIGIDKTHTIMLSSNSLYTAVTRAENVCCVISQYNAFISGVKNKVEQNRITFLSYINMLDEIQGGKING